MPPDPSLEPEDTASQLPKDFVHLKPRFDSAEGQDASEALDVLVQNPSSLPKRHDYVELADSIHEASQEPINNLEMSNQTLVKISHPESDAMPAPTDVKPDLAATQVVQANSSTRLGNSSPKQPPNNPNSSHKLQRPKSFWARLFRELLLETLLPAWLIVTFLFIPVGVRGESMLPTLESGDFLLVAKFERWLSAWDLRPDYLHRGDVIVLKPPIESEYSFEPISRLFESFPVLGDFANRLPEDWKFRPYFVKRIIGVPGDTVELKDGVVYVNSQKTREFYINIPAAIEDAGLTYVKPDTFFVMGDNRHRGSSLDSRVFGLVHLKDIAGRAVLRLGHSSTACKGPQCITAWLNGWHFGAL